MCKSKIRNVRKIRNGGYMMKDIKQDRFIVSVKVGPKGQITIPIEARKMFDPLATRMET